MVALALFMACSFSLNDESWEESVEPSLTADPADEWDLDPTLGTAELLQGGWGRTEHLIDVGKPDKFQEKCELYIDKTYETLAKKALIFWDLNQLD